MSTPAIVRVFDNDAKTVLCVIYKHWDGYPDGPHGLGFKLKEFCKDMKICNGIPLGSTERLANGMGCFAAQLIAYLKEGVGNLYVYPANTTKDECGACYAYNIKPEKRSAKDPLKMVTVKVSRARN